MNRKENPKQDVPTAPPPPAPPLKQLTPDEIIANLSALLRDVGDLSAYIDDVREDGTVVINTFPVNPRPACTTLPKATLLNAAIHKERLGRVEAALEALNRSLASGVALPTRTVLAACLHPDGSRTGLRAGEADDKGARET